MDIALSVPNSKVIQRCFVVVHQRTGKMAQKRYLFQMLQALPVHPYITGVTTSERIKLHKRLTALKVQAEEARVYEEKIHHLADQMIKIDLDDGVKHNYTIFKEVLAPIK